MIAESKLSLVYSDKSTNKKAFHEMKGFPKNSYKLFTFSDNGNHEDAKNKSHTEYIIILCVLHTFIV